ncbi:MAG: glycoside hydrolase family 2 [Clostridia bacterium]|nr:glycoside hydrolase family 2 [Clostridia bacterium]
MFALIPVLRKVANKKPPKEGETADRADQIDAFDPSELPDLTAIKTAGYKRFARLKTEYEVGETPHAEHPLPQAQRDKWLCLNGKWSFQKHSARGETLYDGEILVPFSPETINSGVEEGFVLQPLQSLTYTRKIELDKTWTSGRTVLHFGAVDSWCKVYCNGEEVGGHEGGFTAFSFDITAYLKEGENEICVKCRDEATRNDGARGKQSDERGGIWYTPQSGIWQTVWLENMPQNYITDLKITPNAEEKAVEIAANSIDGGEIQITVYDDEKEMISAVFRDKIRLQHDFQLWSPENPKLYTFTLTNDAGDKIRSYFAVRSFGKLVKKDVDRQTHIASLTLNGKPYFFNGILDQGYWSDGMLTYPSDKAAYDELKMLKDMGFNTVRKHIKIEPMRWYHHCDKLGLIVWQDFVNGGGRYAFTHVAAFPFLGFHHKDEGEKNYPYFAREDERGRAEYAQMVDETLSQLYNCPCIGVWVPFNEGWGQFDSAKWTNYVHERDKTRIVDSVSGWHDQGVGKTDLKSLHIYYTKLKVPKEKRPVVLSEFGGYSMKCEGHVFDESKEFGYKKFKTPVELADALSTLYEKKVLPLIEKGLCGCIYTQVSDVEEEINGLVTYDRKVVKVPIKIMASLNEKLNAYNKK